MPDSPTRSSAPPALGQPTLRDLAPYFAEEGIDVDNIDVPDVATLQAVLDPLVERHSKVRFNPAAPPETLP